MSFYEGKFVPSRQIYIDGPSASIVPFADIHVGDSGFAEGLFRDYVQWILADKNRYVFGIGDYMNMFCHWFVKHEMWNQTLTPNQQKKFLRNTFRSLKERVLAMVWGNHELKGLLDSTTIDLVEEFCEISGAHFLRMGGYFILDVIHPEGQTEFLFVLGHTLGSSRRRMYKLNQIVEQAGFDSADIILVGHQHTRIHAPFTRMRVVNRKYHFHHIDAVRCGSMLNYPEYAFDRTLPPSTPGFPIIDLHVNPKGVSVDIGQNNLTYR